MKRTEIFYIIKVVVSLIIITVIITGTIHYCSETKNEENERKARIGKLEFANVCKKVNEKIINDLNRSENISDEARESIKAIIERVITQIQSDNPTEFTLELWEEIEKEILAPNSWYKIIDWPEIIYRWNDKRYKDKNPLVFKYENGKAFYYLRSENNNSNNKVYEPIIIPRVEVRSDKTASQTLEEYLRKEAE